MKKIYLITFKEFDNDTYTYFFENKAWFKWIFDQNTQALDSMVDAMLKYNKEDCEHHQIKNAIDAKEFLSNHLYVGSRSFENDKALKLRFCSKEAPDTKKELVNWLSKNNYEIADEYEGFIY